MGASFGNSSTTKAPCEVSNLIMKLVLPSRARGRRDRGASVHNGSRRGQAPLSHPCPASHRARGAATPRARGARAPRARSRGGSRALPGRSEEHTSELQSRELISYAVFCLKKKK